jgi:hypothetical protein
VPPYMFYTFFNMVEFSQLWPDFTENSLQEKCRKLNFTFSLITLFIAPIITTHTINPFYSKMYLRRTFHSRKCTSHNHRLTLFLRCGFGTLRFPDISLELLSLSPKRYKETVQFLFNWNSFFPDGIQYALGSTEFWSHIFRSWRKRNYVLWRLRRIFRIFLTL